jgi:hypothetical protein
MVVVNTKVVSILSGNKRSRITAADIAASPLLTHKTFILVFFDTILFLQSLVVR